MAYNILVVDDSATARAVIGRTLGMSGLKIGSILYAANGKEALAMLRDNWIDVVFADINMPVMNGVEMISKMEADGILKTVPVIVVSTEGSVTRMEELMAKGIRRYLRKPFSPESLKQALVEVLGKEGCP